MKETREGQPANISETEELQLREMLEVLGRTHEYVGREIDYDQITEYMRKLSGASYAGFNLFDEGSLNFTTVSISGDPQDIEKANSILGFNIKGKKWDADSMKAFRMEKPLTLFESLDELTGEVIPVELIQLIKASFDVGEVLTLKIMKEARELGDFTLFMARGNTVKNKSLLEIYASSIGMLLEKLQAERRLYENSSKFENIIKGTHAGTWEWNVQTGETIYNERWAEILGYTLEELGPMEIATWQKHAHPEDLIESDRRIKKVFDGEEEYFSMECRMKHKDGYWVWVLDQGKVITRTEDGKPLMMFGTHIDITDSKLLENTVREREENYRILVETSFDIIYRLDLNGAFTYVSKAWETQLDQSQQEALGKSFRNYTHPEDVPRLEEFFKEIQQTRHPKEISDFRLLHSDGYWRWFVTNVTPLWDESGSVTGFAGDARDITEMKESALRLTEQRDQLERFFSVNLDLLLIAGIDGTILKINKSWETTLGYTEEEMLQKNFLDFVHPDDVESTIHTLKDLGNNLEIKSFVNRYVKKDGTFCYLEWKSHPYNDIVYGAARDVTETIRLQESLYVEKEFFKTTLLSVGDCIISTDYHGHILIMNQNAQNLTGWTQEEALGKNLPEVFHIIHEGTRQPWGNLAQEVLMTGEQVNLTDILLLNKKGVEVPIEDSAAPIKDLYGKTTGVVIVFRDVTEKKAKQAQIEYLSFHDYLTGLYNGRYMEDAIKRLDTQRNLPFSIMALDVNGLKLTNDAFGHEMGDQLLRTVAKIMTESCRADDIICRVGGDEFVILLPRTDEKQAAGIKQRIRKAAGEMKLGPVIVSVATGYATKTRGTENINDIKQLADSNMYKNKLRTSRAMKIETIQRVIATIETFYDKEKGHLDNVSRYCELIGSKLGYSEKEVAEIKRAGQLHDVGKVALPPEILNSKQKLKDSEYDLVKRHSETSYQILRAVEDYAPLAEYVLYHHERMDGSGYPTGLKGSEIPLNSRILTVADAYEAMTGERFYKPRKSKEEAIAELRRCAGTQFDSEIVEVFVQILARQMEEELDEK